MSKYIGFDMGYGEIKVAFVDASVRPVVVRSELGGKSWPSYVLSTPEGKTLIGEDARQQGMVFHDQVAHGWKEYLADNTKRYFGGKACASDVVAMLLAPLITIAEKQSGMKVDGIVLTCPANFTDAQRQGLLDGCAKAGVKVVRMIAEPTAAAYAYSWKDQAGAGRTSIYLCIDVGHGTSDVTLLEVKDREATPISTEGIPHLGGRDFTELLKKIVLDKVSKATGKHIALDKLAPEQMAELDEKVERAKHALSGQPSTKVAVHFGGKSQLIEVSQAEFESAYAPLLQQVKDCVDKAMAAAGKSFKDVEKLTLAGGPFLSERLRQVIADHTGLVPHAELDPSSVVSFGAALHAYELAREEDPKGHHALVDYAIKLNEATAHDLGVAMIDKTGGGRREVCWRMVSKNTQVPHEHSEEFKLERPNQTDVIIQILQGPHGAEASACACIDTIHLTGLPPEQQLSSRIVITFKFDSNTIVEVTATDKLSGISKTVSVKMNKKAA